LIMLKLLIAIDGSAQSLRVLDVVGRWARAGVPTEIVLINVLSAPTFGSELPPVHAEALKDALRWAQEHTLREAERRALGCGLSVRATLAIEGAAAQEIVRAAADQHADQIVMGAHGRDAVGGGGLVPGSVAQRVLCLAKQPVLLIP
jgi:nucleotide-binding universal stress UspA family protein